MSPDDKVRRAIRRLLAIAGDEAASPAERELAMERATVLMARHSITGLTGDPDARSREVATCTLTVPGGTSTASLALAYGIAQVARTGGASCYVICSMAKRKKCKAPCFFSLLSLISSTSIFSAKPDLLLLSGVRGSGA